MYLVCSSYFRFVQTNRKHKIALLISRYLDQQQLKLNTKQEILQTKLYMHNSIGNWDFALTNISRETNYFHGFVQYPK